MKPIKNINIANNPHSVVNKILVSHPSLRDNIFQQSVVYLASIEDNKVIGFIINKKSTTTLRDIIIAPDLNTKDTVINKISEGPGLSFSSKVLLQSSYSNAVQ